MSRYESESAVWSKAASAVGARVRALPEFTEARALVLRASVDVCKGRDVPAMREVGGYSTVIEREVAALPERFHVDAGSKMLRASVAQELLFELGALREAVQIACSEAWCRAEMAK